MEPYLMLILAQAKPILGVIIAYFLGSFPTSYLIGRIFYNTDIRQSGSGNSGATNTLRTLGWKAGIAVLIIDVIKGVAAVYIAKYFSLYSATEFSYNLFISLSSLAVILGHVFSVFLKFKGGKGVATTAGVFVTLMPLSFLYCVVLFIFVVAITKYVSVGSLMAAFAFMAVELISQYILKFPNIPRLVLICLIVGLIFIKHKANIKRLLDGNENKISFRKINQV